MRQFIKVSLFWSAAVYCLIGSSVYAQPDTLWTRTFGRDTADCDTSVRQTSDGGYLITRGACSYGIGGKDVWLIKKVG